MGDLISREQAIAHLWKALYEYEDKTEKQFQESDELDVSDWIMNDRLWVQNGHNLCVDVLNNLPSAEKTGRWILIDKPIPDLRGNGISYKCSVCGSFAPIRYDTPYCPNCGARLDEPTIIEAEEGVESDG